MLVCSGSVGLLMDSQSHLIMLAVAIGIDAMFGYPAFVFKSISHPVVWIGALIAKLDHALNHESFSNNRRQFNGLFALIILLLFSIGPALAIEYTLTNLLPHVFALLLVSFFVSSLIAQRSLWDHVSAVAAALEHDGLVAGRIAVSQIVGRNPDTLDEGGVSRAAIESLAENFSDGVVAPVFWCAALGLPGIAAYKCANTADSMIGHKTPRHQAFGRAAARFDDLINLPASRLTALWIILAATLNPKLDAGAAVRSVWRDARKHRSPNAGWPEAAMAGALGLRLAGPRTYGTVQIEDVWMGNGRSEANAGDIRLALSLYRNACAIQFCAVIVLIFLIARV
ncbi:MAG: adenosylcobinamide-phosphate synthase CbiB [Parvibaculaceae bacterium]